MERRVLLAITLSFLVLFLFQRFVVPPPAPRNASVSTTSVAPPPATAPTASTSAPAASPTGATARSASPASVAVVTGETAEREVVVETETVRATFTNRGARLVHWTIKKFQNDKGSPLELVPGGAGANAIKPFTLSVDDANLTQTLNNALYKAESGELKVSFEMATSEGLSAKKTFTFSPTGYIVDFGANVTRNGERLNPTVQWGPGLGDDIARAKPASFFSPSYNTPAQAIIHKEGSVTRLSPTAAGGESGQFLYVGVDDHYFVSIAENKDNPQLLHFQYASRIVPWLDEPGTNGRYVEYLVRYQTPQDSMKFFFGPKAVDELSTLSPEFVRVVNYGMFSILAVPLLGALKWVHSYIGNWGWSIIVLTIIINLVMFPLRHKAVVSMKKMQEIQPQMKAIQDRYAKYKITDPERQKMNEEVMALYKARGVHPASGCVQTLITLPFLFAFYSMLSQSIEIRGADFTGWITNLSAPDPWYITPILMGAAQFWQTKMTPTTMDPAQQKVMMFMPIMFTFMSLSFPSGLVIYWLVSTAWTIGQQYLTNYLIGNQKPARA